MTALKVILIVLGTLFLYEVLVRSVKKFHRFPAPAFIGGFLDSSITHWAQPPDKIIERSGIEHGMTVVDLGCGSGAFSTSAARSVGREGKVYAVDIQPAMLWQIKRKLAKAENQDIKNVELINTDAYDLPFEDGVIDLVYMVAVLQEIPDRSRALREVKRVLKTSGILAVTEHFYDPDYPLRSTTIKICQREGFAIENDYGSFWHYTVRFRKPPQS